MRDRIDLFVASFLVLFLEVAAIRWFPSHVLFLTFFTNTVLLASFLGISVGCLAADRRGHYLLWTPVLLALALGSAHGIEWIRQRSGASLAVGNVATPQFVYFGAEFQAFDPSRFVIPMEAVLGVLFVLIALAMLGPGQQLGRTLARVPNRIEAYTVNILGSLAGVLAFTACSWWQLGPLWWFGVIVATLVYMLAPDKPLRALALGGGPVAVLFLASGLGVSTPGATGIEQAWSPYYRVDYNQQAHFITVNLIGHQQMVSRKAFSPAYSLPHLLNRDAGRRPLGQVLIIGAGSGNDVSRALAWGAERVDAVEIDPVIYQLGLRDHPDGPYSDPRVFVHLDDGRNFLRSTNKKYDLIIYALVDSLVLHSGQSNIRLESYLFTKEAFADIRSRLQPDGMFVMYNYFRQGWIVSRLYGMLEATFGANNPLVFNLPARDTVKPDDVMLQDFTLFFAGATEPIRSAFARSPYYQVQMDRPSDASTPNGFQMGPPRAGWLVFHPSMVETSTASLEPATDTWPFLYLQRPMIPDLSLRGMLVMGFAATIFLAPFLGRRSRESAAGPRSTAVLIQMLFLGAGFMLVETKAVVQMALLFGSTWLVNSIVFAAVLVMILGANLFVLMARPRSLTPFYVGLLIALMANVFVPLDLFLGLSRGAQIVASCLLAFAPILFAGVVFAMSFSRADDPGRAFGMNIAGAMVGGLSENSSMLLGFQYVAVIALIFYAISWASARGWLRAGSAPAVEDAAIST